MYWDDLENLTFVISENNDIGSDGGGPDVVPLQMLGICDTDQNTMSAKDLMMWALANAAGDEEGGYAIRHGRTPVNMFGRPRRNEPEDPKRRNPLAAAYPCLFPYGVGGIEDDRPVSVSFAHHVRWALQYYDRRFRTHHSFPFVVFGILQRRDIMRSARLQMNKRNFLRDARKISSITSDDIRKAIDEIEAHKPVSDSRIRLLNKLVFGCGGQVMGSNETRAGYRSEIWATSVWKRPMNLWITINPNDLHDPLVQVLAGEMIDMDRFNRTFGPDSHKRAQNVAFDPYAAAKYFNTVVNLVLDKLFGITSQRGRVKSDMGLLGRLSAYYGIVEAQGRGTLHLHMFIWLEDSPSADEMVHLLETSEEFRSKVEAYIDSNISAHVPGLSTKEEIQSVPRESDLAYSRPPDPESETYDQEVKDTLKKIVRSQQIHTCTRNTCLVKQRNGVIACKRRAPFSLSEKSFILPTGEWGPKRLYEYTNTFSPSTIVVIKCNMDIKLVLFGRDTKDLCWYVTMYGTKSQNRMFNYSAMIARGFMYDLRNKDPKFVGDVREQGRLLLIRCANAINHQQELSALQVISYLMGWGDVYRSHNYVPFYWFAVASALKRTFRELRRVTGSYVLSFLFKRKCLHLDYVAMYKNLYQR